MNILLGNCGWTGAPGFSMFRSRSVSLYFVRDGGDEGHIRSLEYIGIGKWQRFGGRGDSALGAIQAASPDTVLPIVDQQVFFIQAPHPRLLEQLHNRALHFQPRRGLVFESDAIDPPVNRARTYPSADPAIARGLLGA